MTGPSWTPTAFVQTIARQLDPSSPIYIKNTGPVQSYIDFTYGPVEGYRATGDLTVEFTLKQPSAAFLSSLAMVWNGVDQPGGGGEIRQGVPQQPGRHRAVRLQGIPAARSDRAGGQPELLARQAEAGRAGLQGDAGAASGAARAAAGRGAHPGRCRRGDHSGAAAGGRGQPGDPAGSGGLRRGAALRRQAVRRRAGAARAEPGGGQGRDQQVAVPGHGGAG